MAPAEEDTPPSQVNSGMVKLADEAKEDCEKVAIITGANSGIGFEATKLLCAAGYHVVLACRRLEAADKAASDVKLLTPDAKTSVVNLDLASFSSIHSFVDEFRSLELPLHVLINNAGVGLNFSETERHTTEDGLELTIATNHLGHLLLTNLLLDDLKQTAAQAGEARVIVVTSSIHDWEASNKAGNHGPKALVPLDPDNLLLEREGTFNAAQAYKDSKAANLMMTYELARRLEGTGVAINAMCPGVIPRTSLNRYASAGSRFYSKYIVDGLMRPFRKTTRRPEEGGRFLFELASEDKYKGVTGKYIKEGEETQSSDETRDSDKQLKVWGVSMRIVNLSGTPPSSPTATSSPQNPEGGKTEPEGGKEADDKAADDKEKDTEDDKENTTPSPPAD